MELENATTPEILAELSRRGTTYSGLANLSAWNENDKGMFSSFALKELDDDNERILHNHPFRGCKKGAKEGQTFYLVAVMAPKLVSDSSKDVHQSDLGKDGDKPKSFAGHGKLLIQDPLFGEYLSTEHENICRSMIGEVTTERVMKKICLIESCSELIEGSDALERLRNLRSEFNAWTRARHQEQALSR